MANRAAWLRSERRARQLKRRSRWRRLAIAGCGALAVSFLACAGRVPEEYSRPAPSREAIESMASRVESLLREYAGVDQPGACVLVRHRGTRLYRGCYGMADLERGEPADTRTNFRLASLTKQMTAMAIIQLVEAGRLGYETTLAEIFQDFPAYGERITVRHLLTHTSGLIAYEDLLPEDQTQQVKDVDVLRMMMEQDSTYFESGSQFRYSNSGYAVLAMVIEKVTGERFAAVLADRIFEPLGMRHTVAHEEGVSTLYRRAFGYTRGEGGWEFSDQSLTSAVLGDGGVYSSLEDVERWLKVVEGRTRLVDPESLRQTFVPAKLTSGETVEYGIGWYVDEYDGRARYRHSGSTRGFRNAVQRFPEEDLTIVFLSNRNEVSDALVDAIADACLEVTSHTSGSGGAG